MKMKQMLGFLGASLIKTCEEKVEDAKKMISEFDADQTKKELLEMGERMKEEFKVLTERVKNYVDKYEINVPYDRETETICHILECNDLTVNVNSRDGSKSQNSTFEIPEGVNLNKFTVTYDEKEKKMFFTFSKVF